jgi:hypothetical protein
MVELDYDAGSVVKVELCLAGAVLQGVAGTTSWWSIPEPAPIMCLRGPMSYWRPGVADEVGTESACEADVGIPNFYELSGPRCVELLPKTLESGFAYYTASGNSMTAFSGILTWLNRCSSGLLDYRNNFFGSSIRITFDFTSTP